MFIGRTDVEAETAILWPPDVKNWLIWKDPDAGKDWGQEMKGMTEDKMVGWHHQLNGHEFEKTPGVGDGQGGLVCCSPWGCKESDMTEQLNWSSNLIANAITFSQFYFLKSLAYWIVFWLSLWCFFVFWLPLHGTCLVISIHWMFLFYFIFFFSWWPCPRNIV